MDSEITAREMAEITEKWHNKILVVTEKYEKSIITLKQIKDQYDRSIFTKLKIITPYIVPIVIAVCLVYLYKSTQITEIEFGSLKIIFERTSKN